MTLRQAALRALWEAVTLAVLAGGLWASVNFMLWALALWSPERIPQ